MKFGLTSAAVAAVLIALPSVVQAEQQSGMSGEDLANISERIRQTGEKMRADLKQARARLDAQKAREAEERKREAEAHQKEEEDRKRQAEEARQQASKAKALAEQRQREAEQAKIERECLLNAWRPPGPWPPVRVRPALPASSFPGRPGGGSEEAGRTGRTLPGAQGPGGRQAFGRHSRICRGRWRAESRCRSQGAGCQDGSAGPDRGTQCKGTGSQGAGRSAPFHRYPGIRRGRTLGRLKTKRGANGAAQNPVWQEEERLGQGPVPGNLQGKPACCRPGIARSATSK